MTLYPHPQQHNVLDNHGKMSPAWQKYFEANKDEVNRGENPAAQQAIAASVGIKVTSQRTNITIRIISATAGDTNVTANPRVSLGFDGQVITLVGEDDTKTVTLADGNGLKLSASITLKEHTNLVLEYNKAKALWIEKGRALT
ncbi:MAG: hypothetical protein ACYSYU_05070 [Planctomycetota bacterium]|jgi:hypothetical protein